MTERAERAYLRHEWTKDHAELLDFADRDDVEYHHGRQCGDQEQLDERVGDCPAGPVFLRPRVIGERFSAAMRAAGEPDAIDLDITLNGRPLALPVTGGVAARSAAVIGAAEALGVRAQADGSVAVDEPSVPQLLANSASDVAEFALHRVAGHFQLAAPPIRAVHRCPQGSGVDWCLSRKYNHAGLSPAFALDGIRQVGFGGAGIELSLRSGWFALTALILLPLSRRLRRGADADLCDVAALPPLVAPMFGLPAVEILGDAGVHDPVAKLEVVLVRRPAGRHGCSTPTPRSI